MLLHQDLLQLVKAVYKLGNLFLGFYVPGFQFREGLLQGGHTFGAHGRCWQLSGSQGLGRSEGESSAEKNAECVESDEDFENTVVDFEAVSDWPSRRSFSDVRATRSWA